MDTHTRSNGVESRSTFGALPALTEPQAWATVEGYEIREVVRRTPTSDVFLTYHRPTGAFRELIVVQRVPGVDQAALRETIEAEVAAARALVHVGIVPVEDVGLAQDGRLYVATGRPVGRPLHTLLAEDGRLPVLRAFELGHTLVTAVAVAHERGVAHGWLTPDSVIVIPPRAGWPERVVVLGFGTAAAQDGGLGSGAFSADQLPYASPERAAGDPPSFQGDVFSLGSLLLRMLVGSTPSVVHAAYAEGAPREVGRQPGDMEHLLRTARAVDPAWRYRSASELGAALWTVDNAWFDARTGEPARDARVPATIASPARRRALVAAGVLGVLAAGAAGATVRVWHGRNTAALEAPLVATARPPAPSTTPAPAVTPPVVDVPDPNVPVSNVPVATALAPAVAPARRPVATTPTVAAAPSTVTSSPGDVAAASSPTAPPASTTAVTASTAPTATGAAPTEAASTEAGSTEAARGSRAGEVLAAVAEYGTAIGARDLDRLARVYPAMTEQQRRGWTAFFGAVTDLRAPLTVEQITFAGPTAQVRVRAAYEYENLRPHRAERSVVNYKVTLARDGAGWRIRAVE